LLSEVLNEFEQTLEHIITKPHVAQSASHHSCAGRVAGAKSTQSP